MKDHYKEYEKAGVVPGNLENDRLLTDKEMEAIPLTNFGDNTDDLNIARAQDAKTSKRLLEKFNQWADGMIASYQDMPPDRGRRMVQAVRIDTFQWAKENLKRLLLEIQGDRVR